MHSVGETGEGGLSCRSLDRTPLPRSPLSRGADRERLPVEGAKKEGQQVVSKGGISSPTADVASPDKRIRKAYFETKYSVEGYEKKFNE